jgi:copper chaperone CopZ
MVTTQFTVTDMHCSSCASLIQETLVEDLGVSDAVVDLESAQATVTHDPAVHSVDEICTAVARIGYTALPVGGR